MCFVILFCTKSNCQNYFGADRGGGGSAGGVTAVKNEKFELIFNISFQSLNGMAENSSLKRFVATSPLMKYLASPNKSPLKRKCLKIVIYRKFCWTPRMR